MHSRCTVAWVATLTLLCTKERKNQRNNFIDIEGLINNNKKNAWIAFYYIAALLFWMQKNSLSLALWTFQLLFLWMFSIWSCLLNKIANLHTNDKSYARIEMLATIEKRWNDECGKLKYLLFPLLLFEIELCDWLCNFISFSLCAEVFGQREDFFSFRTFEMCRPGNIKRINTKTRQ